MKRLNFYPKHPGHVLPLTLTVLAIILILVATSLTAVQFEASQTRRSYALKQAFYLAEAALEHAVRQLNSNSNYPGEIDTALGEGTFSIDISGTGNTRTIDATGYIPNSTNPIAKRRILAEAVLDSQSVEFFYGIQVDGGGVQLSNNAGVIGNVYSNGNIIGSNGAFATGDVIVAGGLNDNPTLSWENNDANQIFAETSNTRAIAQSFIATESGNLNKISVLIAKVGNPTANISVRVAGDTANRPGSTVPNGTATISHNVVGNTPSWINISFSASPILTAGNKYWIVLSLSSANAVNHWLWRKDSTDGYANNTAKTASSSTSSSWANLNADLAFHLWQGGTTTRIEGMTIGSQTTGSARANAFVNTTVRGASCPNTYCVIDNPPPQSLPISDGVINDWKQRAAAGGTHNGNYSLSIGQQGSLGPRKIEGNLILSNSAVLTLTGTVWVTGTITVSNNAVIRLDPAYGNSSGVLLSDSVITVSNGAAFQGSGATNSYILLLTTRDAKNEVSISVSNNSVGVIYYAGKSLISFSNNAAAKEATAWGITMSNNATITYDSGLANSFFSNGPGGGWQIQANTWREATPN